MNALTARARAWMRSEHGDASGTATVNGRRIYILPSRYGVMFGVLLLMMLIGSLNYDNNPAYLITFFLISVAVNAMYQTWRNLRGVTICPLYTEPVFSGQKATLRFELDTADTADRAAIQVDVGDRQCIEDLPGNAESKIVTLTLPAPNRGWWRPGRVTLSTRYPLGLYHAWCYVDLDHQVLVYPKLGPRQKLSQDDQSQQNEGAEEHNGNEDFFGLRDYQQGDSPRHIDWKSLARERGLMSKQFTTPHGEPRYIDWFALPGNDVEQKISALARAVVDAEHTGQPYALRIPGKTFDPAFGPAHRHACLSALACFEGMGTGA